MVDDLFGIEVDGGLDFGSDDVLSCFGLGVDDHNWLLDSGNGDNLGLGFDDLEDLISSKDSSDDGQDPGETEDSDASTNENSSQNKSRKTSQSYVHVARITRATARSSEHVQ